MLELMTRARRQFRTACRVAEEGGEGLCLAAADAARSPTTLAGSRSRHVDAGARFAGTGWALGGKGGARQGAQAAIVQPCGWWSCRTQGLRETDGRLAGGAMLGPNFHRKAVWCHDERMAKMGVGTYFDNPMAQLSGPSGCLAIRRPFIALLRSGR